MIVYSETSVEKDRQVDMPAILDDYEKRMIVAALETCKGVKAHAAELLKINRTTLLEKMKKHELPLGPQNGPQMRLNLRKVF